MIHVKRLVLVGSSTGAFEGALILAVPNDNE